MKEKRGYSAAAHHEKKGFLITGGLWYQSKPYTSRYLSSCEITKDGLTFEDFTPLPIGLWHHCAVALNDDNDEGDFFVAGGDNRQKPKRTFIHKSNQWNEMTQMPTGRQGKKPSLEIENELTCLKHFIAGLMCGPVRASQGGRVEKIVAAGGQDSNLLDRVDIYDITRNTWMRGG